MYYIGRYLSYSENIIGNLYFSNIRAQSCLQIVTNAIRNKFDHDKT